MRRILIAVGLFALAGAVAATAVPADPAPPSAQTAARCKKKHKRVAKHKRKRCRRGQAGGGEGGAGSGPGAGAPCLNSASYPGRVAAHESEYVIQLSRPSVGCGVVILEQNTMSAMDPHDLVLLRQGDSSPTYTYGQLGPGGVASQTLNLSRGNWTLYCSVLDHRSRGMEVTLQVD